MDEKPIRPAPVDRLTVRTSERVAAMSDEARAALFNKLTGKTRTVPHRAPGTSEKDPASEAARLTTELRRTESRLGRLERAVSRGRYQTGSDAPPSGRYARLLTRADRLERKLRSLR